MKKILIIILFLSNLIFAQSYPRWHGDELFYPHVTTLGSTSWIMVNNDGQTSVIQGTALASFLGTGSALLTSNNTWTGTNTYSQPIGLASLTGTTVVNGFFMNTNSDRPAYYYNGQLYNLVNQDDLIPYSLGDTLDFAKKSATNIFTGTNNFDGIVDFDNKVDMYGATEVSMPVLSSLPSYATKGRYFFYNDNMYFVNANLSNIRLAKYTEISAGNYWPLSGSFSGATTAASLASGSSYGILFGDGNQVGIPYFSNINDLQSYRIGWTSGGALYFGTSSGNKKLMNEDDVSDAIDVKINLAPVTIAVDTIDLASANRFMYDGNDNVTFTISNIKQTSFELFIATQGITIAVTAPSGYTIEWLGNAIEQPSDQGDYKYIFEVWGTVIKAYLAYRD